MLNRPAASILCIVAAVALVIGYRYEAYVARQAFTVNAAAPCDPSLHACFAADCSPVEDASCDTSPYEKVALPAAQAPDCLLENSCDSFSCDASDDCTVTYCSADTAEDGEVCTDASATSTDTAP